MTTRARPHPHKVPSVDLRDEAQHREYFRDALFTLLQAAVSAPDLPPVAHAVDALRQWFLEAPLEMVWMHLSPQGELLRAEGAVCADVDGPPAILGPALVELRVAEAPEIPPATSPDLRAWYCPDDARWRLVITRTLPGTVEERFLITLPAVAADSVAAERRAWFCAWQQGMQELVTTIHALHAVDRDAELERRVDDLVSHRTSSSFDERLVQATALVRQLRADGLASSDLARAHRLARHLVHDAIGTGWLSESADRHRVLAARQFARELLRMVTCIPPSAPPGPDALAIRLLAAQLDLHPDAPADRVGRGDPGLRAWRRQLDELRPRPDNADNRGGAGDDDLWLLAAFTGAHRALARFASDPGHSQREHAALWAWLARHGGHILARVVGETGSALDRERLAMWFAMRLLPVLSAGTSHHHWMLRSSQALVVREALRQRVHADRADYVWQPERYAQALLDLVELHVHEMLGLPHRLDVRGLLGVSRSSQAPLHRSPPTGPGLTGEREGTRDAGLVSAHRQHVLELYLAGQLLLDTGRADAEGAMQSVDGLLASGGTLQVGELRCAHALAVLFHDCGILVLDRMSSPRPWPETMQLPREAWSPSGDRRRADVASFLAHCATDLHGAGLLAGAPTRGAWEDHGLVSAWILLHLGRQSGVMPAILHHAVRAVLLHADVNATVDVTTDPAAALLVLCDQLYEWEPSTVRLPDPGAVGLDPDVLAPWAGPRPSRVARITLDGLELHPDGRGLVARVHGDDGWPALHLHLHHPELSGRPTWQVWLLVSQHLGRIRTRHAGWTPSIRITAPIPGWMLDRGLTTATWLETAAWQPDDPSRPLALNLRTWLARRDHFSTTADPIPTETLLVHTLHHDHDVRLDFAALGELLDVIENPRRGTPDPV